MTIVVPATLSSGLLQTRGMVHPGNLMALRTCTGKAIAIAVDGHPGFLGGVIASRAKRAYRQPVLGASWVMRGIGTRRGRRAMGPAVQAGSTSTAVP